MSCSDNIAPPRWSELAETSYSSGRQGRVCVGVGYCFRSCDSDVMHWVEGGMLKEAMTNSMTSSPPRILLQYLRVSSNAFSFPLIPPLAPACDQNLGFRITPTNGAQHYVSSMGESEPKRYRMTFRAWEMSFRFRFSFVEKKPVIAERIDGGLRLTSSTRK